MQTNIQALQLHWPVFFDKKKKMEVSELTSKREKLQSIYNRFTHS